MDTDPCESFKEMGGEGAFLEPEESVKNILSVVAQSTPATSGKFFHYTGKELPW